MRPRAWLVAALALAIACAPAHAPAEVQATALRVFELARSPDPDPAAVDALFGPDDDARRRAALYDALARLGAVSEVRVAGSESLEGLPITAVDLVAELPGSGQADFAVQLRADPDGTWQVVWLAGPGFDWPPRDSGRGEGLTTSAPPTESGARGWE